MHTRRERVREMAEIISSLPHQGCYHVSAHGRTYGVVCYRQDDDPDYLYRDDVVFDLHEEFPAPGFLRQYLTAAGAARRILREFEAAREAAE